MLALSALVTELSSCPAPSQPSQRFSLLSAADPGTVITHYVKGKERVPLFVFARATTRVRYHTSYAYEYICQRPRSSRKPARSAAAPDPRWSAPGQPEARHQLFRANGHFVSADLPGGGRHRHRAAVFPQW